MIQHTKQCDICGKRENYELKCDDFMKKDSTQLLVKDHNGDDVLVNFNISINKQKSTKYDPDEIVDGLMKNYSNFNHVLEDEDDFDDNMMGFQNFMHQQNIVNQNIMKRLKPDESHICKSCYNGMIMLLHKFGKMNTKVKI